MGRILFPEAWADPDPACASKINFCRFRACSKICRTVRFGNQLAVLQKRSYVTKKPKAIKPGKVQKIIKSIIPDVPEKAEIAVEGADHLYKEIRIENTLEDEQGRKVKLKEGAQVEVVVEADPKDTVLKKS
jgi:hypothetical protein